MCTSSSFETVFGIVVVTVSVVLFEFFSYFVERKCSVPYSVARKNGHERWFNAIGSLLHSSVTGIGSLCCFYIDPNLAFKICENYSFFAFAVASFSLGYFIHDFIQSITRRPLKSSWEILLHHAVVILCFGICVVNQKFVNFVVVALLCEVNSIFLHIRQLLKFCNFPKNSKFYKLIIHLNIFSYIFFRICTLSWMVRWLVLHKTLVPYPFHSVGVFGMSIMTGVNLILFAKLIRTDYIIPMNNATSISEGVKKE